MEKVTTIVVDKTGTLTEGRPRLTNTILAQGTDETELLTAAASVEQQSEHPLAAAIVAAAKEKSLPLESIADFNSVTGGGVSGKIGASQVLAGSCAISPRAKRLRSRITRERRGEISG